MACRCAGCGPGPWCSAAAAGGHLFRENHQPGQGHRRRGWRWPGKPAPRCAISNSFQFHPNRLMLGGRSPLPDLLKRLRGEGARLVDHSGPEPRGPVAGGDLAPRDQVTRPGANHAGAKGDQLLARICGRSAHAATGTAVPHHPLGRCGEAFGGAGADHPRRSRIAPAGALLGWAASGTTQRGHQPAGGSYAVGEVWPAPELHVPIAWPAIRLMELPGCLRGQLGGV